jgi:hypothetical protein
MKGKPIIVVEAIRKQGSMTALHIALETEIPQEEVELILESFTLAGTVTEECTSASKTVYAIRKGIVDRACSAIAHCVLF